jgi:dihydroorotase
VLFNPDIDVKVDPKQTESGSRNTPYRELTLPGKVMATFFHGQPTVLDGQVV